MENTSAVLLTKRNVSIFSGVLLIVATVLGGLLIALQSKEATPANSQTGNTTSQVTTNQTSGLQPGQTNPNIVGFGQTFECNPRSDEEYYRTGHTFVVNPDNTNVMYVHVEYKGFHKSVDGGKTWKRLENGIKTYGSREDPNKPCYGEFPFALIDPENPERVVVAASSGGGTLKDLNGLGGGIFESRDGGTSFKQLIRDDMNGYISSITFDPKDSSILYYGTNSSPASYLEADPNKIFVKTGLVHKFANGTWTELPTSFLPYTGATGVHVNPNNTNEVVVFTLSAPKPQGGSRSTENVEQMGVLRSQDGGNTWQASHPLPKNYEPVIVHDVAPQNFQNMFVTPFGMGVGPKSFYSTDSGKTFKESSRFMDYIKYDPHTANGNRLLGYAWQGTSGPAVNKLFESTDAGATWHEFANLPAEIKNIGDKKTLISNIVWDPADEDTFYMTGAGGLVWKTTNNGQSWTKLLDYSML